jgi:Tfp pilus assembly protein PilV
MKAEMSKRYRGLTLIEVVIAAVILFIAILGGLSYQYHTEVQNRIASCNLIAERVAQLLLEDWKNNGGSSTYDPATLELGFLSSEVPDADYYIFTDNLHLYITLGSSVITTDEEAGVTIRQLDVKVRWRRDYREGAPEDDDPYVSMTTYVRNDASGG